MTLLQKLEELGVINDKNRAKLWDYEVFADYPCQIDDELTVKLTVVVKFGETQAEAEQNVSVTVLLEEKL